MKEKDCPYCWQYRQEIKLLKKEINLLNVKIKEMEQYKKEENKND